MPRKTLRTTLAKTLIVLFCLWHVTAVGVYALPGDARGPVITWIRQYISPKISPYMLITSQWQQWNLFSPDPLRRVTVYVIETRDNSPSSSWRERLVLKPGSFPWWRHASQFKMLGSLLEWDARRDEIVTRFLHLTCQDLGLASGLPIRLTYRSYVIPKLETTPAVDWWLHWQPEMSETPGVETTCATVSRF